MPTPKRFAKPFDRTTTASSSSPDAVPAFESSAGIPRRGKEIKADPLALQQFNSSISPEVMKHQIEVANVAALFAKRAIRPDEIAALRRRMFEVVNKGLNDVEQVILGQKQWSNTQVRLFSILTERVMPKLSNITVEDPSAKKLEDLSLEELEAIALGKKKADAVDAVMSQAKQLDQEALVDEERALRKDKEVIKKVGTIAAIDEIEKVYAKKKVEEKEVAEERKAKKPRTKPATTPQQPERTSEKACTEVARRSRTSGSRKA